MPEFLRNPANIHNTNAETAPLEEPLGIKNPLLSATPLGQSFLSAQFILPLGAKPINLINWSLITPNETAVQSFIDEDLWQDSSFAEFQPLPQNLPNSEILTVRDRIPTPPTTSPSTAAPSQPETPTPHRLETTPSQPQIRRKKATSPSHFFLQKSDIASQRKQKDEATESSQELAQIPEVQTAVNPEANTASDDSQIDNITPEINRQPLEDNTTDIGEDIPQKREFLSRFISDVRSPAIQQNQGANEALSQPNFASPTLNSSNPKDIARSYREVNIQRKETVNSSEFHSSLSNDSKSELTNIANGNALNIQQVSGTSDEVTATNSDNQLEVNSTIPQAVQNTSNRDIQKSQSIASSLPAPQDLLERYNVQKSQEIPVSPSLKSSKQPIQAPRRRLASIRESLQLSPDSILPTGETIEPQQLRSEMVQEQGELLSTTSETEAFLPSTKATFATDSEAFIPNLQKQEELQTEAFSSSSKATSTTELEASIPNLQKQAEPQTEAFSPLIKATSTTNSETSIPNLQKQEEPQSEVFLPSTSKATFATDSEASIPNLQKQEKPQTEAFSPLSKATFTTNSEASILNLPKQEEPQNEAFLPSSKATFPTELDVSIPNLQKQEELQNEAFSPSSKATFPTELEASIPNLQKQEELQNEAFSPSSKATFPTELDVSIPNLQKQEELQNEAFSPSSKATFPTELDVSIPNIQKQEELQNEAFSPSSKATFTTELEASIPNLQKQEELQNEAFSPSSKATFTTELDVSIPNIQKQEELQNEAFSSSSKATSTTNSEASIRNLQKQEELQNEAFSPSSKATSTTNSEASIRNLQKQEEVQNEAFLSSTIKATSTANSEASIPNLQKQEELQNEAFSPSSKATFATDSETSSPNLQKQEEPQSEVFLPSTSKATFATDSEAFIPNIQKQEELQTEAFSSSSKATFVTNSEASIPNLQKQEELQTEAFSPSSKATSTANSEAFIPNIQKQEELQTEAFSPSSKATFATDSETSSPNLQKQEELQNEAFSSTSKATSTTNSEASIRNLQKQEEPQTEAFSPSIKATSTTELEASIPNLQKQEEPQTEAFSPSSKATSTTDSQASIPKLQKQEEPQTEAFSSSASEPTAEFYPAIIQPDTPAANIQKSKSQAESVSQAELSKSAIETTIQMPKLSREKSDSAPGLPKLESPQIEPNLPIHSSTLANEQEVKNSPGISQQTVSNPQVQKRESTDRDNLAVNSVQIPASNENGLSEVKESALQRSPEFYSPAKLEREPAMSETTDNAIANSANSESSVNTAEFPQQRSSDSSVTATQPANEFASDKYPINSISSTTQEDSISPTAISSNIQKLEALENYQQTTNTIPQNEQSYSIDTLRQNDAKPLPAVRESQIQKNAETANIQESETLTELEAKTEPLVARSAEPKISQSDNNYGINELPENYVDAPSAIQKTEGTVAKEPEVKEELAIAPIEPATEALSLEYEIAKPSLTNTSAIAPQSTNAENLPTTPQILLSNTDEEPSAETQTVAQLLSQPGATSQLPAILENLAHTQPLGIAQPFIQRSAFRSGIPIFEANQIISSEENTASLNLPHSSNFRTANNDKTDSFLSQDMVQLNPIIQRQLTQTSAEDVPDSWSSIEELLAETSSPATEPTMVQTFSSPEMGTAEIEDQQTQQQQSQQISDIRTSALLPPGVYMGATSIHSFNFQQQPTSLRELMEKTLQSRAKLEEKAASQTAEIPQQMPLSSIGGVFANDLQTISSTEEVTKEEQKKEQTDCVEALAREIYSLLRQRLEIERERYGSYYSHRLL